MTLGACLSFNNTPQTNMTGRIRRKLISDTHTPIAAPSAHVCPLCERVIPVSQRDAHHLIPKSKGGKETEYLHRICHRQIHALFTETELARRYNNVEALLSHPEMIKFVSWVRTKPEDFYERTQKSQRLKPK
jgi:5-methylcytosine-specific restriction endonuclease McrA